MLADDSGSEDVVGVKLAAVPIDTVGDELLARSCDTLSDDWRPLDVNRLRFRDDAVLMRRKPLDGCDSCWEFVWRSPSSWSGIGLNFGSCS